MNYLACLFLLTLFVNPSKAYAESTPRSSAEIIEEIVDTAWAEIELGPQIYPHFFVYGIEVEATVGLSDFIEVGSSMGVDLHFERRTR